MRITSGTLVLALFMAMAGCAGVDDADGDPSGETAAAITPTATSQLFVTSVGADTVVSSAVGVNICPLQSSCTFTYPAPIALSIDVKTILSPVNDCLRFVQWTGACAGQGRPCSITLANAALVVSSTWQLRPHCIPN